MSDKGEEQCLEDMSEDYKQSLNDLMFANKCLNILIEFKLFVDSIFDKIKDNLEENDFSKYNELNDKVQEVYENERYINGQNIDVINALNRRVFNESIDESQSYKEEADSHLIVFKDEICDNSYSQHSDHSMDQTIDYDNSNGSFEYISRERKTRTKALPNTICTSKKRKTKTKKLFDCDICDDSFSSNGHLVLHKKNTHSTAKKFKIRCEVDGCDREFVTTINYKIHMEYHNNGVVKCPVDGCDKVYDSEKPIIRHLELHRLKSRIKRKISCDWPGCQYKDWTETLVRRHKFLIHTPDEVSRTFECEYPGCGKKFKIKQWLTIHQTTHMTNQEVICEFCGKTSKNEQGLKKHIFRQHIQEKNWTCDHPGCKFRGAYQKDLIVHQKYHSESRPFVCTEDGCKKSFTTIHLLKQHMSSHITERTIECPFEGCDRVFNTMSNMKSHIKHKHSNQELRCDWPGCDYVSKALQNLRIHSAVHKTQRDFVCEWPECGKSFKTRHSLRNHINRHTKEKRYFCQWPECNYETPDAANYIKHKKQVHEKNSSY